MKKTTISFLLISLFAFAQDAFSQVYHLELTNMSNGKTRVISQANNVKIITVDGRSIMGAFSVINDSTLLVDNILINLSDVRAIKLKHTGTKIAGSVISGVGLAFTGIGLFAFTADAVESSDDFHGCGMIVGGITAGCGLLLFLPGQLIRGSRISYSYNKYLFSITTSEH